jgi:hypothetical protein
VAAPTLVQAGTGNLYQSGAATAVSLAGAVTGNLVVLHFVMDGNTSSFSTSSVSNIAALDGTANSITSGPGGDGSAPVGAASEARLGLFIGRATGSTPSVSMSSTGDDLYFRLYEFTNVNTGSTLASIIENSTAGNFSLGRASSATIADVDVTTIGPDRLAVNFIGVDDDDQASFDTEAFTGQTGGTWVSGGSYGSATGTDGAIGLQYAAMAAAGTIGGGTLTIPLDNWGVIGFALIGTTAPRATFASPTNFQDPGLF